MLLSRNDIRVHFKIGETAFNGSAIDQVWDYALDLKNFHEASHNVSIVPILVVAEARESPAITFNADADGVYRPVLTIASELRNVLHSALRTVVGSKLDAAVWARAPYHPTPTIVGVTNTVFFAAVTVVPVIMTMVCITQNMLSIPETRVFLNEKIFSTAETLVEVPEAMVPAIETLISTTQAMVFLVETTVCGTKTIFSEAEPIFFAPETDFSITENTVGDVPTMFV